MTSATIKRAAIILARRRAAMLSPEERSEAARQAALARWDRLRECAERQKKVIL
jgi:hypothetical protein